ncbi:MAG: hypothetical protein F9K25_02975 [Candidatus Contendobacter sp.]|nr:MAG: hypothetical protein F9K25_02975 [Candidatus Contendobacter sp.]
MDTITESTPFHQTEFTATPVSDMPDNVHLDLWLWDADLVQPLLEHPAGRERDEFIRRALRVGILALQQAQSRIDADSVRREGEHFITQLGNRLSTFQNQIDNVLTTTLKDYLDPRDGRFVERVERLIRNGGDLENVMRSQTEAAKVTLQNSLEAYLGADSPIARLLTPDESNALLAALQETVNNLVASHLSGVMREFSLDNRDGALVRLVDELSTRNSQLAGDLRSIVQAVAQEFSLGKADSALNQLIQRVESAQQRITAEFTLDDKESALSRLRAELTEIVNAHKADSANFQQQVLSTLATMQARKEERQAGVGHGRDFEQAAYALIETACLNTGDIADYVANQTGRIRNSKVGDAVVTLGPDAAAAGVRIVCEMKEDSSYRLAKVIEEIGQARDNRNAQVGLFIWSRRTAPAGQAPLARYGMDVVVHWDAEDETTDVYLHAGLMVTKAIAASARSPKSALGVDFTALDKAILEVQRQAGYLDEIATSSGTIKQGAEKILKRVETMRKALECQIEVLNEQVGQLKSKLGDAQPG